MKSFCYSLCILLVAFVLGSCKKEKETVPSPVEGLKAHGGRNRAEVTFDVPGNAKSGKVFYGNGSYKTFTIEDPTSPQRVTIDALPEQEQTLRVVTMNEDGQVSDPRAVKVTVYGSKYESGLKPRKWADQVTHSATSLQFLFDKAIMLETGVQVVYTTMSGTKDSVFMSSSLHSIDVNNIDTSKPYYYYSVYKPETSAIDNFYSPPVDLKTALMLDFKKSNWTIAGSSGAHSDHIAENIIDNDPNTAWTSKSGGAFPHWVTVDMGNAKYVDGFYYLNYPGDGNGARTIKLEFSMDNINWSTGLQTEVEESYFRQRLELPQTITARYFKISVLDAVSPTASQAEFLEIDAYNNQNVSGENGYLTSTPVNLVNAKSPFTGDGSNPFPALGAFRMQKVAGWTHSSNAIISYDNNGKAFSLFIAPVWGLAPVGNGKVHQTVDLQRGHYVLKIRVGGAIGPCDVYGVISRGTSLPDYSMVTTSPNTISYINLVENQNKTIELLIIVTEPTPVNIGVVYNLRDQYAATGTPWTSFNINAFELTKVR